jgi:uncharacterized membrane protein
MARLKRSPPRPETAPGEPDWVIVGLALVGVVLAGYLAAVKLAGSQAFLCRAARNCDLVQASRYSMLAGVPTAMWGAAAYLGIAILAALPRTPRRWQAAFMLICGAVAASVALTFVSIVAIGATCPYCLASGVVAAALLAAMIARRPRGPGRSARAYGSGRLVALGLAGAIVTVGAGAFVFAVEVAPPDEYRIALARHLGDSGAVFYGAFW